VTSSSAGMTEGYTDTLVGLQIFVISRAKFSYFVIFSASVLARLWVKGTAVSITGVVLFCLSVGAIAGLLKPTDISVLIILSEYNMPADCSTVSGFVSTVWRSVYIRYLILYGSL
jgi:hypothetical protein